MAQFSFPLRRMAKFFPKPHTNIQKIRGTDAATPPEIIFKGPLRKSLPSGGVLKGMVLNNLAWSIDEIDNR